MYPDRILLCLPHWSNIHNIWWTFSSLQLKPLASAVLAKQSSTSSLLQVLYWITVEVRLPWWQLFLILFRWSVCLKRMTSRYCALRVVHKGPASSYLCISTAKYSTCLPLGHVHSSLLCTSHVYYLCVFSLSLSFPQSLLLFSLSSVFH